MASAPPEMFPKVVDKKPDLRDLGKEMLGRKEAFDAIPKK